jgi:hypothetical protein
MQPQLQPDSHRLHPSRPQSEGTDMAPSLCLGRRHQARSEGLQESWRLVLQQVQVPQLQDAGVMQRTEAAVWTGRENRWVLSSKCSGTSSARELHPCAVG